ncbi:hypothetical protein NECAME_09645 [Necator americanus]|uniref:Uncharacterized protein n=1 Tax=Necator americanus TaxID=51031 RepID=W2TD95_NECAM|nr:hypothetical protein NECAME_09645 [Necator americanus]ETN79778.1 hypothetical protein NECAME_09645 [Necator americanus]
MTTKKRSSRDGSTSKRDPQHGQEHILKGRIGDSCEREIDATDPLHPSSNELSGAKLLLRRAIKEVSPDLQPTVPGQVLRNHKGVMTTHGPKSGYILLLM